MGSNDSALVCCGICNTSFAQNSVTLYGIIDESIQYTHNTGGESNQIKLQSGQMSISQWGMRGTEDLGGSLSALFSLQNGFNINTGKMNSRLLLGARHILNASARLVRAG